MQRWAYLLIALLSTSCGDALFDGAELDKPALTIHGTITPPPANARLAFGIVWADPAQQEPFYATSGSELVSAEIAPDGSFALSLEGNPDPRSIRWIKSSVEGGTDLGLAWGEIVLYEDWNGDGTFRVGRAAELSPIESPDVYRGFARQNAIMYLAQGVPPGVNPITGLEAVTRGRGYKLGTIPCADAERVTWITTDPSSSVPIQMSEKPMSTFPEVLRDCWNVHPPKAPSSDAE